MSALVGNPEDRFSHNEAQIIHSGSLKRIKYSKLYSLALSRLSNAFSALKETHDYILYVFSFNRPVLTSTHNLCIGSSNEYAQSIFSSKIRKNVYTRSYIFVNSCQYIEFDKNASAVCLKIRYKLQ